MLEMYNKVQKFNANSNKYTEHKT